MSGKGVYSGKLHHLPPTLSCLHQHFLSVLSFSSASGQHHFGIKAIRFFAPNLRFTIHRSERLVRSTLFSPPTSVVSIS